MRKKQGVALVLALFTTAILVTLSLAFLTLAIGESRNSRGSALEKAALESANYGLDFALNYMGSGNYTTTGGVPVQTWGRAVYPGAFTFYNVLLPVTSAANFLINGTGVIVDDITTDSSLASYTTDTNLVSAVRKIRLVSASGTSASNTSIFPLGSDLAYSFEVVVIPVWPANEIESFRVVSTAKIYSQNGAGTVGAPLATRVVEAQVLPSSASSFLHFLSNARGLSSQGIVPYSNQTLDWNGTNISVADFALIPANFTESGPMRVDGEDPSLKSASMNNATNLNGPLAWYNNSGDLKFASDVGPASGGNNSSNVTFRQPLTIQAPANEYGFSGVDDTNSGIFAGGLSTNNPRLGLPLLDLVNMTAASQYVPSGGFQSGFFNVSSSQIPGALGSTEAAPRCSGPNGDPFYTSFTNQTNPDGTVSQVGVPFDYRPRIPNVEVSLAGDQITVQTRDTLTGNVVGTPQSLNASQLATGVLFVQGGNTVVHSTASYSGQLSIVSGDSPQRDSTTPNSSTIYAQAATELFNWEQARWDTNLANGSPLPASQFQTPPYNITQLQAAAASGVVTSPVPNLPGNQTLWPAPAAGVNREGNVVVSGDIVTTSNKGAALGLFAQNFVLLNPNNPTANNNTLTIDAVMMSRDRNVSLDWDNTGRQPTSSWQALTSPGFNGTLSLQGSIVGEFIDVEGDFQGRGYTNQNFAYNSNLKNLRPPLSPAWDFSMLPGGFRFVITHYTDDGALSTNGVLP